MATVYIKQSSAAGIASFIFGIISIFFMAPIFVPLAVIFAIIAIASNQKAWGITGIICSIIGFITSPILMGIMGITTILANTPHHTAYAVKTPPVITRSEISKEETDRLKNQALQDKVVNAVKDCRQRRLNGEFKTYKESTACGNEKILDAYRAINYPNMDLVSLLTAKRMELAERVDAHELTEAQAGMENSEFLVRLRDKEIERNKTARQYQ